MKNRFVFFCLLIISVPSFGQYALNYYTTPYEEISNPISLNNGVVWDKNSLFSIDFGFEFQILDQKFTDLIVKAGGGINFPGAETKELLVYHSPFGGYFLKDKGITTSMSPISYEIQGNSGQKILKIQWENPGFRQATPNPPDTSNFVDFQIWLFEEDSHIEIHFGNYAVNEDTYGSSTGPSIKLFYDLCSNMFGVQGPADHPTYWYFNSCQPPNYTFIDGTPSMGTTYNIYRTMTSINDPTGNKIGIYPNPVIDLINIESKRDGFEIQNISIYNSLHQLCFLKRDIPKFGNVFQINLSELAYGIYTVELTFSNNEKVYKRIYKNSP